MISTALRIRELLKERRWTTKILAEKTGLSESYLTHMKNGTRRWNEDALRKIAYAFEVTPVEMLVFQGKAAQPLKVATQEPQLQVMAAPVVNVFPANTSPQAHDDAQKSGGTSNQFVPVIDRDDSTLFCYKVSGDELAPLFHKNDLLVVSPKTMVRSGDIGAVEWQLGTTEMRRGFRRVTFMDEFIVLDTLSGDASPVALVRGRDHFRSLGKLIFRYQSW